jgi:hypothetical protein
MKVARNPSHLLSLVASLPPQNFALCSDSILSLSYLASHLPLVEVPFLGDRGAWLSCVLSCGSVQAPPCPWGLPVARNLSQ